MNNPSQYEITMFNDLKKYCKEVFGGLKKPNQCDWINGDYIHFSNQLFKKTHIHISSNTLKRIFGKTSTEATYFPQKATRDALAQYVGYLDWENFIQDLSKPEQPPEVFNKDILDQSPHPVARVESGQQLDIKRFTWGSLIVIITLGIVCMFTLSKSTNEIGHAPVELICKNPSGGYPHTAIFSVTGIDQGATNVLPYSVDFGDSKMANVSRNDSTFTHYYERPGRYWVSLNQGGKNIDSLSVYLATKGWETTGVMPRNSIRFYPLSNSTLNRKSSIGMGELSRIGIDTNQTFFIEIANIQPTDINGDNFELSTQITTSQVRPGVYCSQYRVTIFGDSTRHGFDIIKPGCEHWADLCLSNECKSGTSSDLRLLGADLRKGGRIKFRVVNQEACLFINDRKVLQTRYTRPLHRIYGVKLLFGGFGVIHSFTLKDLKTGTIFDGNF